MVAWKLNSLPGKREATMEVKLTMPSLKGARANFKSRPVEVNFDIAHYTLYFSKIKDNYPKAVIYTPNRIPFI